MVTWKLFGVRTKFLNGLQLRPGGGSQNVALLRGILRNGVSDAETRHGGRARLHAGRHGKLGPDHLPRVAAAVRRRHGNAQQPAEHRRCDRARAVAHVERKPGHLQVVERDLAQRRLRTADAELRHRSGTAWMCTFSKCAVSLLTRSSIPMVQVQPQFQVMETFSVRTLHPIFLYDSVPTHPMDNPPTFESVENKGILSSIPYNKGTISGREYSHSLIIMDTFPLVRWLRYQNDGRVPWRRDIQERNGPLHVQNVIPRTIPKDRSRLFILFISR